MARVNVTVTGEDAVAARLRRLGQRASDVRPIAEQAGAPLVADVRRRISEQGLVRTGAMRASVRVVDTDSDSLAVAATVPYARFPIRGTRYVSAHPVDPRQGAVAQTLAAVRRHVLAP